MSTKSLALILLLLFLGTAACATEEKEPAPASPAASPAATITYEKGFFDEETSPDLSWRWMSDEGIIRLRNFGQDAQLVIRGNVPLEPFPQPPTLTVKINGEQIDQFTATSGTLEKTYTVSAAQQGSGEYSELRISTSKIFIPKEVDKKSTDERRLGFSLHKVIWQAK